jgi:hypothetical protein
MKTRIAMMFAWLLCAYALCASAAVVEPDKHGNFNRVYGYVFENKPVPPGGYVIVFVPCNGTIPFGCNNVVRFDYYTTHGNGAASLVQDEWVVIHGYVESQPGCLDGPNTFIVPQVVWRWDSSTASWLIFDHDLLDWVVWP